MQWARRQHQTGRKQKLFIGIIFGMLVALLMPLLTTPASAHALSIPAPITRATTLFADDKGSVDACNTTGNPLTWVICPVIDIMQKGTDAMQSAIDHMMQVDVKTTFNRSTDTGKAYYAAWNSFRIIAVAIIVIAGLVMVISTALGFEFFDAYTIKKVLPRILVAVIGISLSWWLMEWLANFTNDVGVGIRSLMYQPFQQLASNYGGMQSVGSSLILALAGGGALLFLSIGGVLSLLATAGLAALVAFLVLVIRQVVIIFLILIAPLAIACYALPNTQKAYHLWWDSLAKGMMMFPIISAFIAAGQIFSVVASSDPNSSFGLSKVVAVLAYFLPYFALPFTFRLAGGAIATLGGLANDRSRGAFDRLKGYRGNKVSQNLHDMKTGNRFQGSNAMSRAFNRTSAGVAAVPHAGLNPRRMAARMQSHLSTQSMEEAAEFSEKNAAMRAIINNDDFLTAGIRGQGNDRRVREELQRMGYRGPGLEQGVAAIRAARRAAPDEVFDTAAAMALPATGTAFRGGAGEMHDLINEVAGDDRVKAGRMLAAMRSGAASARRFDLAGGGFGDQIGTLEAQHAGTMTTDEASRHIIESSLEGQGGSYIAGARNGAVQNFAPVMREQLNGIIASGDEVAINQELAKIAGRYDAMAQVAPENAEILANEVMGATLVAANGNPAFQNADGTTMTVRQMVEAQRDNNDFLNMRREYGAAARNGAIQAQNQPQNPQGPVVPPPIPPVGG